MRIHDSLTVNQIANIRQSILSEHTAETLIDISEVSQIDLAGIQFLVAVFREFPQKIACSRITGVLLPSFRQSLVPVGITGNSRETGKELELQLEGFL